MDSPTCRTCVYWERHDTVSDRHGAVIAMRKEGLTQEEVAHVFRVSSARIRQIEKEKSTGLCRRYPTNQKKAEADFCGEHPDFPAFIESRKAPPQDKRGDVRLVAVISDDPYTHESVTISREETERIASLFASEPTTPPTAPPSPPPTTR